MEDQLIGEHLIHFNPNLPEIKIVQFINPSTLEHNIRYYRSYEKTPETMSVDSLIDMIPWIKQGKYNSTGPEKLSFYSMRVQFFLDAIFKLLKDKDSKINELENELFGLKYRLKEKLGL